MPQIKNWTKTTNKTVKQTANGSFVYKWKHQHSNDTISIQLADDIFNIFYNDEIVTARDTLTEASKTVINTMKENTDGL